MKFRTITIFLSIAILFSISTPAKGAKRIGSRVIGGTLEVDGNTTLTGTLAQGVGAGVPGTGAVALNGSIASGTDSFAATGGTATALKASALGATSQATATNAHADSAGTASGSASHADSAGEASGGNAHAGASGEASGLATSSHGFNSLSSGDHAHSLGYDSTASGDYSIGIGEGVRATHYASVVIGNYDEASNFLVSSEDNEVVLGALGVEAVQIHFDEVLLNVDTTITGDISITGVVTDTLHVQTASAGSFTASVNADDLVVENNGHAGISIKAPDASNAQIYFGNPGSSNMAAFLSWDLAAEAFTLSTNNSSHDLILQSAGGNVGVDEVAPDSKLEVNGTFHATGNAVFDSNLGVGTPSPGNQLDIITGPATNDSEFHLGEAENEGLYLTSTVPSLAAFSGGAELDDGAWIARGTEANIIQTLSGEITWSGNTGLTDGVNFVPTVRMTLDASGKLSLSSGTDINEFSTDTALGGGGASDDALPTELAVKTYVDTQGTAQDLDIAGDSGTGAVDLDSQSLTVAGTSNEIETAVSGQTITVGLPSAVEITTSLGIGGTLGLQTGTTVNEFSVDGTLAGNSDDAIPTEKAVKTYVDAQSGGSFTIAGDTGTSPIESGDTLSIVGTDGQIGTAEDDGEVVIRLTNTVQLITGATPAVGESERLVVGNFNPGDVSDGEVFIVASNTTNTHFMVGESGSAGLTGSWQVSENEAFINTFGYTHDLNIDANELAFQALSGGNSGFGIADPAYKLDVLGIVANDYVMNIFNAGDAINRSGLRIRAGDADHSSGVVFLGCFDEDEDLVGGLFSNGSEIVLAVPSDRKLKENITTSTQDGLDIVRRLRVVDFKWKSKPGKHTGVIAQELEEFLPSAILDHAYVVEATAAARDEDGYSTRTVTTWDGQTSTTVVVHEIQKSVKMINKSALIMPLVNAIQQQQKQIKRMKSDIASLQSDRDADRERLENLENMVNGLHSVSYSKPSRNPGYGSFLSFSESNYSYPIGIIYPGK